MKCPKCDGTGKAEIGVGAFTIHGADCDQCNGKGIVEPMTNEEYLRSCDTEQLAEWIAKQKCDGCNDEPYDDKHGTCKYCMTQKTEQIREWLKQPHNS